MSVSLLPLSAHLRCNRSFVSILIAFLVISITGIWLPSVAELDPHVALVLTLSLCHRFLFWLSDKSVEVSAPSCFCIFFV